MKQIDIRRFDVLLWKFLQHVKNALTRRDKTISETNSETVVASVSCFGRMFAKTRQTF